MICVRWSASVKKGWGAPAQALASAPGREPRGKNNKYVRTSEHLITRVSKRLAFPYTSQGVRLGGTPPGHKHTKNNEDDRPHKGK